MLLIFDCDGVLVDSMRIHNEIESEFYREIGIPVSAAEVAARFSGVPQKEILEIFAQETGKEILPDTEEKIDMRKEKAFSERLQPVPGVHEALKALDAIPRCVASSARLEQLKHVLTITQLYSRFVPHIYSTEMVARGKPAPDVFLHAAQQMGYAPESCLVIEDSVAGVQAARAAGMKIFGFTGGSHCGPDHGDRLMKEGAGLVFSDMTELSGLLSFPS